MAYHYERCGEDRFRMLCSAVLAPDHPGLVALGYDHAATGRQGFDLSPTVADAPCVHAAFASASAVADTVGWMLAILARELPRIQHAARRGASRYILITNANRPDAPSVTAPSLIDEWLSENCPIPATCLWREDLDRRLDWGLPAVKLAYPEILQTGAVHDLVAGMLGGIGERGKESLFAFISRQSDRNSALPAMLVDVPESSGLNAAGTLLSDAAGTAPWRVLVGDPGAGKSVVVEHVCRVHRARLLDDDQFLDGVDSRHATVAFRLPISVDAREYADYLRASRSGTTRRHPETFACFLVKLIGGAVPGDEPLTADDVLTILRRVPVLVVIDRLDELGHRASRELVIGTSLDYLAKLRALGADIHVIVTSRPEAYGPLPDPERLQCLRLAPLGTEAIIDLVERWLVVHRSGTEAGTGVLRNLAECLELTDFRSLAATPLHLTLALETMARSGSVPPGRRADFFGRSPGGDLVADARTTAILGEHRHLLADFVQHLAWLLACESESGKSSGTIDSTELASVARSFLADRGEAPQLAARLFDAIECLPVLTEGADGRFGFRDQFVREFFCAQHLFRSAPDPTTGRRAGDDRSSRFVALSAHSYWTNVTRFYAGFCEPGALPALLACLTKSISSRDMAVAMRARALGGILLADRVFRDREALRDAAARALYDPVGLGLAAHGPLGIGYRTPEADCGRGVLHDILLREHLLSDTPAVPAIAALLAPIRSPGLWETLSPQLVGRSGIDRTALLAAAFSAGAHLGVPTAEIEAIVYGDAPAPNDLHVRLAALLETATTAFSQSPRLAHDLIAGLLRWGPLGSSHASVSLRQFAAVLGEGDATVSIIEQLAASRDYRRAAGAVEAIRAEFGDSWATFALAAAACGIPRISEVTIEAKSLLDARLPLCDRALAARVWRGSEVWWAAEIARATSTSERMFWVVVLVGWGSSQHIAAHLPAIDAVLTELDDEHMRLVIDALRSALEAREVHGGRRRPPMALPDSVGDRTALLIALAFGSPSLAWITADRRTSEPVVRSARQALLRQKVRAFTTWDALGERAALRWVGAVAESRLVGDELPSAVAARASRGTMPMAAARRVLLSAASQPAELVEIALRSIQSTHRPTPVGETAARGWRLS